MGFVLEKSEIKGGLWSILSILNLYISKWIFRRGPFFPFFFEKKINKELSQKNGFFNIILKFKKI